MASMPTKKDARVRKPREADRPLTPFAQYIRKRRQELNLTQKEIARRVLSERDSPHYTTYISALENGRRSANHSDDFLKRYAAALEVPYFQFLEETGRGEGKHVIGMDDERQKTLALLTEALYQLSPGGAELLREYAQMLALREKRERGGQGTPHSGSLFAAPAESL